MASESIDSLSAHAVVRTWLRDQDRKLWPWMDADQLERLIASLGAGADPLEGEEVVATLYGSGEARGGCIGTLVLMNNVLNPIAWVVRSASGTRVDWNYGALVTDERLVLRDWLDAIDAPFTEIHDPSCTGGFLSSFGVDALSFTIEGERQMLTLPGHRALYRLLTVVGDEARAGRLRTERMAPPYAEPDDASGARSFAQRMRVEDDRAKALLSAIFEATAAGRLTEWEGLDLAQRTALLHRATVGGRGSHGGLFVSGLRRGELLAFFESTVGSPEEEEPVDELETLVFHRDRDYARAALGTALVLASGRIDGVLPRGDLRLSLEERNHPVGGDYCGYRLEVRVPGMWQPMSEFESGALYGLHKALLAFEAQVLLRRALFGAALSPTEVLALEADEVEAARAEQLPQSEARWFSRPRNFARIARKVADRPDRRALPRRQIPGHLAPPPITTVPGQVGTIGIINAFAGFFTFALFSTAYCFGGVAVLTWAENAILAHVPGLDESATTGLLALVLMAQWGLLLLTSPIRAVLGLVVLVVPKASGWIGWFLVITGLIGLLLADVPGFLAALVTAALLTRPRVREYLAS